MSSIIEIHAPRIAEHPIYVEDYSYDYTLQESPIRFTTSREQAKKYEHEDALRVSNFVFDYFRINFKSLGFPKDSTVNQEFFVQVQENKKDDGFPFYTTLFMGLALFIALAYDLSR